MHVRPGNDGKRMQTSRDHTACLCQPASNFLMNKWDVTILRTNTFSWKVKPDVQ